MPWSILMKVSEEDDTKQEVYGFAFPVRYHRPLALLAESLFEFTAILKNLTRRRDCLRPLLVVHINKLIIVVIVHITQTIWDSVSTQYFKATLCLSLPINN